MINFYSALSSSKQPLKPLHDSSILMYVCGITPYDHAHIGHGRVFVTFDLIFRFLSAIGYKVTYCRNFTDVDDKIINRALQETHNRNNYHSIAQRYINSFLQDMHDLAVLKPTHEPLVTETINEIISFIENLIDKKSAYVSNGNVYFSINSFPSYGSLSKQRLDELRAGARVEIDEHKKDPLDFALWKKEDEGSFFKSPWGYGRPGWHIECSAMALKYLGKQIDIHGGGADLIFPHHENERAQTESLTHLPFASCWMHCAFVRVNKEKMSKSLGNFFTLRDVFKQFDPMVIRYYYLIHLYRTPLDFSVDDIHSAQKAYQKLCIFFQDCQPIDQLITDHPLIKNMISHLADDLNTPGMFGALYSSINEKNISSLDKPIIKKFIQEVLGLNLKPLTQEHVVITPEIQALIDEREEARQSKDWKKADQIREQLKLYGYIVQDKKHTS